MKTFANIAMLAGAIIAFVQLILAAATGSEAFLVHCLAGVGVAVVGALARTAIWGLEE